MVEAVRNSNKKIEQSENRFLAVKPRTCEVGEKIKPQATLAKIVQGSNRNLHRRSWPTAKTGGGEKSLSSAHETRTRVPKIE